MRICITINSTERFLDIEPYEVLLDVLRRYGYLSVKRGCDTSSCGVCTVLMDEKPVLSCSILAAAADGHSITTAEGIQEEVKEVADFLVAEGSDQCGFCGTGFIMTVIAMKKELKNPDEEDIKHYLAGNLCRCSGYAGQLRAVKKFMGVV